MRAQFISLTPIVLIALVFATMTIWTWNRWADPIANGRELYIPWRIASGDVLYRDIPHVGGPFSQYFNSLMFRVFGTSIRTLVISNLAWLLALVAAVWMTWKRIADRTAATVSCLTLLTLFSFTQFTFNGGFNFILPYVHEMTHGVILSFVVLVFVARRQLWPASLALGFVLLTRAEIFLAIAPAVLVGFGMELYVRRATARRVVVRAGVLLFGMLLPFFGTIVVLSLPPTSMLDSWRFLLDERISGMRYFQIIRGTDAIDVNIGRSIAGAAMFALAIGAATFAGWAIRRQRERLEVRAIAIVATPIVVIAGAFVLHDALEWQYIARGVNVAVLAIVVALVVTKLSKRRDHIDAADIDRLVVSIFALLMLVARMPLRVVLFDQGFIYAMPATLLVIAAIVSWIPNSLANAGGLGAIPRLAAISMIGVIIVIYLQTYARAFHDKRFLVGAGADALRFDVRGVALRDMANELIARRTSGRDTLLVVPEGAFLNYYTRMRSPTGHVHLMPPDVEMSGGAYNIRDSLDRAPLADWVVVVKSDPGAFGFKAFDVDYGRPVWRWIEPRYTPVVETGDKRFSMRLYQRTR